MRYDDPSTEEFTQVEVYSAYLLEYWKRKRDSLHVKGNSNKISDFKPFEEFEIVEDDDEVFNLHEVTVRCVTHRYDEMVTGLKFGREYKAISRDRDGLNFGHGHQNSLSTF